MIAFDEKQRLFILRTARSCYALRVLEDGRLVHIGFFPSPSGMVGESLESLESLERYPIFGFCWEEQGELWELPASGDVAYHDVALRVVLPQAPCTAADGDAPNLPLRDLRLRYHSHRIGSSERPLQDPTHGLPVLDASERPTLSIELRDAAYDIRVTLCYRLDVRNDVVERFIEVRNQESFPIEIEKLGFACLVLPPARWEVRRPEGTWGREFSVVPQALSQGRLLSESFGLNTGHAANPFFLLSRAGEACESHGDVYFGALAYSGNWQLAFEVLPTGPLKVIGAHHPDDFRLVLEPGQSQLTPSFVMGCAADGFTGASQRLHGHARDRILPRPAEHSPQRPVLYNSWEASYFDLSLDNQLELARRAARIGVELFCVDDGWFGARRSDRAGLGDWTVSEDVFPGGLRPLVDEVHRLGMLFGLWVEPEMVNPDSDLYRAHPEWALHYPGRPRTESRAQLVLDFGRREVVDHIHAALDALVREYQVDFFKWDMNRYVTEPGSVAGRAIALRHVEGLYTIMDRLRRDHPHLSIQSCSGGGGRIDLGVLARTDQAWVSDNTDAYHRIRIQDGYSLAYPTRAMECWVTHEHNHQTGERSSLALRFDCAMRGVLGIGSAIDRLTNEELDAYAQRIAFYKRIRAVVQDGRLFRLELPDTAGRSVWQFVREDQRASVLSVLSERQTFGRHRAPPRLRGLVPSHRYRASDYQGADLGTFSGFQLMTLGFPDRDGAGLGTHGHSLTVWLEAE
jgi:alpha-galactosidase